MASDQGEPEFNRARAELFEALGHPIRIRILQAMEHKSLGFADLKKAAGIESSGHLSFHLGKLEGLLKVGSDGNYSLTDEGREALHVVGVTRNGGSGGIRVRAPSSDRKNIAIAALVIGLLLISSIAVFQQQQIGVLNHSITTQQAGTIVVNGTRYSYLDISLHSLSLPATIYLDGVAFNLTTLPWTEGNITTVETPQQGGGGQVTLEFESLGTNVQVKFADGASESWQGAALEPVKPVVIGNLTGAAGLGNQTSPIYVTFVSAPSPWFTHHTSPRAGVSFDSTTDMLRLLVSMGA